MQPSPSAETSKLLFPSLRFFIFSRVGSNALEAVSRSSERFAYSSRRTTNKFDPLRRTAILLLVKDHTNRAHQLRSELARRIAAYMGSSENRATGIPGVTLHRRTAPTAPCSATYEPGVTVMAQGRKRVDLGRTTFIYGESH